jgi:hypothetical protein
MRIVVAILLLLGAHFSLTACAPAPAGRAWLLWPFAAGAQPILSGIGGLPRQSGSVLTPLLASLSGLAFLAAALSLFDRAVPAEWWLPLIVLATGVSILLHALYAGPWALLPLAVDALLLWGVLALHWSVPALRGM